MTTSFFPFIQLLLFLFFTTFSLSTPAQTQKGFDLDGEAVDNEFGHSVSMPDAQTIAIGGPLNSGNGNQVGHVRVFSWNGNAWVQKGADIDGDPADQGSGFVVSMPDANTVGVGIPYRGITGAGDGKVRVYKWNGGAWVQKGADIDGREADDNLGLFISMPDSNTIGIGAPDNHNVSNGTDSGKVYIYTWINGAWTQKGGTILGEQANDRAGRSISMPDAETIAIGAFGNDGNGTDAGHARIFEWNGSAWTQKGSDIDGQTDFDGFGVAVSMPDAQTVAISAHVSDAFATNAGQVRIFAWNGTDWIQKGADIYGEASWDFCGYSISMPDAATIAIGAYGNDASGDMAGNVRIFGWNGSAWVQRGASINGEAASDQSGFSVSMPDFNTVAIGANFNSGNGAYAGHVRVYENITVGIAQDEIQLKATAFPNPTTGSIGIDLGADYQDVQVLVRTLLGQEVMQQAFSGTSLPEVAIPGQAGVYLVEIRADEKFGVIKVVKE